MKFPKIKNLIEKIKGIPEKLCRKAFLVFFALFFIFLIFGCLIYYKYLVLEIGKEPQLLEKVFEFDQKKYQKVSEILKSREEEAGLIDSKEFRDPFHPLPETQTSSIIFLPSP